MNIQIDKISKNQPAENARLQIMLEKYHDEEIIYNWPPAVFLCPKKQNSSLRGAYINSHPPRCAVHHSCCASLASVTRSLNSPSLPFWLIKCTSPVVQKQHFEVVFVPPAHSAGWRMTFIFCAAQVEVWRLFICLKNRIGAITKFVAFRQILCYIEIA